MDTGLLEHFTEDLCLALNVLIVPARELLVNVLEADIEVRNVLADSQCDLQHMFLSDLEHMLIVLGAGFRSRPAITKDDSCSRIRRGVSTVPIRDAADAQYCRIQIFLEGLRLILVKIRLDNVHICRHAGNRLDLDGAPFGQFLQTLCVNIAIDKLQKCLDFLFHTIHAV